MIDRLWDVKMLVYMLVALEVTSCAEVGSSTAGKVLSVIASCHVKSRGRDVQLSGACGPGR